MKKDYIVWERNGYYKLFKDGRIQKPDGYMSDGKLWEFVGLLEKKPYGKTGFVISRGEVFKMEEKDFYYKNGKPKFYVVDIDHGTRRIWMQ